MAFWIAWFACSAIGVYAWHRARHDYTPRALFIIGLCYHALGGPLSFPALIIFRDDWLRKS